MSKNKTIDENGFETYRDCKFFCECVADYLGSEIDPEGKYGLKKNGIYKVYRPKSEISKKEFIESLNAKPVLDDHCLIGNADGLVSPDRKHSAGVLTEVKVVGNELHGRIDVWSPSMLSKIHDGKVELSLAYACEFKPKRGVFNGENYDFVQSNLRCGNHLAFVDEARNGHDCRVKDGMFARDEKIQLEKPDMDISTLSADEVVEALKGCSDEVRAKCKDFLNTPEKCDGKNDEKTEPEKASDEQKKCDEDPEKKDEVKDKAEDPEKEKKAEDKDSADDPNKDEEAKKEMDEAVKAACCDAKNKLAEAYKFAEDCKAKFGVISMDGIFTKEDVAMKICSLKKGKLEKYAADGKSAIVAVEMELANTSAFVGDSVAVGKMSAEDYFNRK